jgi:hypothetical protein
MASGNAELGKLCGNGLSVARGTHQLVDVEDTAVGANVEGPSGWKRLIGIDHAVGSRDAFVGIAQERIVDAKRLRESLVRVRRVNADRKERDFEGADVVATLTE